MRNYFIILCLFLVAIYTNGCKNRVQDNPPVSDQEDFARQVSVPPNIRIVEINHSDGDLTVRGWDKPFIVLEGTKKVVAKTVGDARYTLQEMQIIAYETPPNRLVLEYQGSSTGVPKSSLDEQITYIANVPRNLALDIEIRHASITVENQNADVSIDHRFGDVALESIGGKAQIRSEGGRVTARSIDKSLKLDTREADLLVENIGEEVAVRHNEGEIEISDVDGALTMNCMRSEIKANDILGRLDIDNRRGDVVCDGFREGVRAYVLHGTLKLAPRVPVPQSYYCDVDDGNIILRVPEESSMILDVQAERGRIHSDFPMNVGAESGVSYGKGVNNEGRFEVRLRVRNGSASIFRSIELPPLDQEASPTTNEISDGNDTSSDPSEIATPEDAVSETALE